MQKYRFLESTLSETLKNENKLNDYVDTQLYNVLCPPSNDKNNSYLLN